MRSETRASVELGTPTTVIFPFNGAVPTAAGATDQIGFQFEVASAIAIRALWLYVDTDPSGGTDLLQPRIWDVFSQALLTQASEVVGAIGQWQRLEFALPFIAEPNTDYTAAVEMATVTSRFSGGMFGGGMVSADGIVGIPPGGGRFTAGTGFPNIGTNDGLGVDIEYTTGAVPGVYFPPQPYDRLVYDVTTVADSLTLATLYEGAISPSAIVAKGSTGQTVDTLKPIQPYLLRAGISMWVAWDEGLSASATMRYDIVELR